MENFDINSFDFDSMAKALGSNPFEQGKKSYKDERFYTLPKNKDGSGQAIIALLPDAHKHSIIKLFKINTTIQHGLQSQLECHAHSMKLILITMTKTLI